MAGATQAFAKILSKSDVEKSFHVPAEWLPVLPPLRPDHPTEQLWVVDGLGFSWEFWCSLVPDLFNVQGLVYAKCHAVFEPSEWRRFADHKGLKPGDRLVLESRDPGFLGINYSLKPQRLAADGVSWLDL